MVQPQTFRRMRTGVSAFFMILCALLVVLWVRSYWWIDMVFTSVGQTRLVHATSFRGKLGMSSTDVPARVKGRWTTSRVTDGTSVKYKDGRGNVLPSFLGFQWSSLSLPNRDPSDFNLIVPYWFPAVVTGVLGIAVFVPPVCRFSLRTLLIVVTLVAAALGLIVLASR